MMSYTTEENFSIELTFNYGIHAYALGNDLAGIHVAIPGVLHRAREKGIDVHATAESNVFRIYNPDGQCFFLHEDETNVADPFLYISLNSDDIESATGMMTAKLALTTHVACVVAHCCVVRFCYVEIITSTSSA